MHSASVKQQQEVRLWPWFLSLACDPKHTFEEASFLMALPNTEIHGLIFQGVSAVSAPKMKRMRGPFQKELLVKACKTHSMRDVPPELH